MELVEETSVAFGEKELVEIYKHTLFVLCATGYKPEKVLVVLNRIRSSSE